MPHYVTRLSYNSADWRYPTADARTQEIEAVVKQLEAYSAADLYEKAPSPKGRGEQEEASFSSELVTFRESNPGELRFPQAEQMIKMAS